MLDFRELSEDGQDLELLTREILVTRGYSVQWSGKGTDGGRDLICVESRNSFFMPDEKRWLIQCKHNAKSNKAVGVRDLGDIVDTCAQHSCSGFLLVCSTYPSSAVVQRLESISRNTGVAIEATYWDMVRLEQILSTPKNWPLAQRFFPTSANAQDWRIYATESPNNWVVNYKGYYFHLNNRIGSSSEYQLESIRKRVADIEKIEFPNGHCLRIRAAYYDDKNENYKWYLDQMYPLDEEAAYGAIEIERILGDGYALEDGRLHFFDVINRSYNPESDHHDFDHYGYYTSHGNSFSSGLDRSLDSEAWLARTESEDELDKRLQATRDEDFNALIEKFSEVDFVDVVNSTNAQIEYLDRFYKQFNWSKIIEEVSLVTDRFFSVWIMVSVGDDVKFHELVSCFPQEVQSSFRLARSHIYLPNDSGNGCYRSDEREDDRFYELTYSVHPYLIGNKATGRNMINQYLRRIARTIDQYLNSA